MLTQGLKPWVCRLKAYLVFGSDCKVEFRVSTGAYAFDKLRMQAGHLLGLGWEALIPSH